eukprot:TRINITY_DN5117_c0_g1_i1.p1 TRINITY_DN5117_c0_g1~~TRINITY_DN5117_c0_g1_i1.p1  ORF type:complete len:221 (+),score=45.74 TRINITY_DN5117_c0_g1_i1:220-882(+)
MKAINIAVPATGVFLKQVKQMNTTLRGKCSDTFVFDENRHPHITLLQLYVKETDLPELCSEVESVVKGFKTFSLSALKLEEGPTFDKYKMPSLSFEPGLHSLHQEICEKIKKFAVSKESMNHSKMSSSFSHSDKEINQDSTDYVKNFLEQKSGSKYAAHMTIGISTQATAKDVVSSIHSQFAFPMEMDVDHVVVSHLGNFCTVREIFGSYNLSRQDGRGF